MKTASGRAGEEHIAQWLVDHGYEMVARNYHSRYGEIDLIAQKAPYLCFIEVKTREENSLVSPFEAISPTKQRKIFLTALEFLQKHPIDLQPRFDAAAVILHRGKIVGEQYLENAF